MRTLVAAPINLKALPDGDLDCVIDIQRIMTRAGFQIQAVEAPHRRHALALRHRRGRLAPQREATPQDVGKPPQSRLQVLSGSHCSCVCDGRAGASQA